MVGVEDPRWGESGLAFVVLRPGVVTDEQDLLEHCSSQLARFKVPGRIEMVAGLPRTALNKVLRAKLREDLSRRTAPGAAPAPGPAPAAGGQA